jgi:hypothetical protein
MFGFAFTESDFVLLLALTFAVEFLLSGIICHNNLQPEYNPGMALRKNLSH